MNAADFGDAATIVTFNAKSADELKEAITNASYSAVEAYVINVSGDIELDAALSVNMSNENAKISLRGTGSNVINGRDGYALIAEVGSVIVRDMVIKSKCNANGAIVSISTPNGKLTLEQGASIALADKCRGVIVGHGGTLIMNKGASIYGNVVEQDGGGGAYVSETGKFIMNGGSIYGNTALSGAGVLANGTFEMNGGDIYGNEATQNGGGVGLSGRNATFIKRAGATIYGNGAASSNRADLGDAVSVYTEDSGIYRNDNVTRDEIISAVISEDGQSIANSDGRWDISQ
jgi:hypothetical protein